LPPLPGSCRSLRNYYEGRHSDEGASNTSQIAPEIDPQAIKPGIDLRDQIDLDPMDYLIFVIAPDAEWTLADATRIANY